MRRDNHPIRQDNRFLWDARNIRFTAVDDNTLMSITNEKGTSGPLVVFPGSYRGHCMIGKYLVVFICSSDGLSKIYRIDKETLVSEVLYSGQLNMSSPI